MRMLFPNKSIKVLESKRIGHMPTPGVSLGEQGALTGQTWNCAHSKSRELSQSSLNTYTKNGRCSSLWINYTRGLEAKKAEKYPPTLFYISHYVHSPYSTQHIKVQNDHFPKPNSHAGRVAQVVGILPSKWGTEFKPQFHQIKKKLSKSNSPLG
jgi:hypothetical protein